MVGLVILFNDKRQPIDTNDKTYGVFTVKNLTPDTTYSGWSFEAYTTYSTEPVIQIIADFTTKASKK